MRAWLRPLLCCFAARCAAPRADDPDRFLPGNLKLRKALDTATKLTSYPRYREEIERLRQLYAHRINVLPDEPTADGVNPTCYAFALGLANNQRYRRLILERATATTLIDTAFTNTLISKQELRPRASQAQVSDVVLYFDNGRLRHAGVLIALDGMVRSKWGPNEIHEHPLWEVPLSYGNTSAIYIAPDPSRVLALVEDAT